VDYSVKIWDVESGACLKTLTGQSSVVRSVSWSPDGTQVASGSGDIKVWDVASGDCLKTLTGHSSLVNCVSWGPDGTQLASASTDGSIKVWDVASGTCLKTLTGHSSLVNSVSWSPDGTRLASGSRDNSIKVWDVESGVCLNNMTGHLSGVSSVSWSPDGSRLASGSGDSSIKIWDVSAGTCLTTLTGHSDWVLSINWSPDGTRLASGSNDNSLKIWSGRSASFDSSFNELNSTLVVSIFGRVLDDSVLLQLSRKSIKSKWLGCTQVSLHGSNSSLTASLQLLAPGVYGMSYYDRYRDQSEGPWTNLTDLTVNCPAGQGVEGKGEINAKCVACGNSTYSANPGLEACGGCKGDVNVCHTNCTECPDKVAYFNGERCACNNDHYSSNTTPLGCFDCPSFGAVCNGDTLRADDNFWQTRDNKRVFLVCTNLESCRNGECTDSYEGYLCGECRPGYGQRRRLCEECPDQLQNSLILVTSVLASLTMFLLLIYLSLTHQAGEARMSVTALKVGLSAAQMNAMLSALGVRLTPILEGLVGLQMNISGSSTVSLSCAFLNVGYCASPCYSIFPSTTLSLSRLVALGGIQVMFSTLQLCCGYFSAQYFVLSA